VNVVLGQAFPARIATIEALRAARPAGDGLRAIATQLAKAADGFGRAPAAADWGALSKAVEIAAQLADWRDAVDSAEMDADRHLRAAHQRAKAFAAEEASEFGAKLTAVLEPLAADTSVDEVADILRAIAGVPMPVAVFGEPETDRYARFRPQQKPRPKPEDVSVAFLEFKIDGIPAQSIHSLTPGELHDLELIVSVSRWPVGAEKLRFGPVSVEPTSTWDFPEFEVSRPEGDPPYTFTRSSRMLIKVPQHFTARPLQFQYAAEFQPRPSPDENVVVAGQRTLLLDGTDASKQALTGYPAVDAKVIGIRNELRNAGIPEREIHDLLLVLRPLCNLMGQAATSKRYPDAIDEKTFQSDVETFLRANYSIGADLEIQAEVAGGRTDLSFKGLRIELKSERKKRLGPPDCAKYAEQGATYAVGSGKRLATLCVLDCSPKKSPPFPIEDGLTLITVKTAGSPVLVVSLLLQGNFPRPSDHSR